MKRGAVMSMLRSIRAGASKRRTRPPHGSRVRRRRRAALLRFEHACGGAAHVHVRAEQRHFPYLWELANRGLAGACEHSNAIKEGVNTYQGHVVYPAVANHRASPGKIQHVA